MNELCTLCHGTCETVVCCPDCGGSGLQADTLRRAASLQGGEEGLREEIARIIDPLGLEVVARMNARGDELPEHGRITRDDILRRLDEKTSDILSLLQGRLDGRGEEGKGDAAPDPNWRARAEKAEGALLAIYDLKPVPIGDTGFAVGPASLLRRAQEIAHQIIRPVRKTRAALAQGGADGR